MPSRLRPCSKIGRSTIRSRRAVGDDLVVLDVDGLVARMETNAGEYMVFHRLETKFRERFRGSYEERLRWV